MNNIIHYLSMRKTHQLAALSITPLGNAALTTMQQKLRLAADELHRMEDESGIPLSNKQHLKVARYLRASTRLQGIMRCNPPIVSRFFLRKRPNMFQQSPGKLLLYAAVIIIAGIAAYTILYAPDRRDSTQKISDAIDELPNGLDKAARQLESRTPADKLQDAAQDATDDIKKSTNQQ